ncbi:hypothetical protein GQX74_006878 [Glossina fuscipes]|nr:hypothetical protein GQX74_006878 [Glossina fuscipes]
MTESSAHIASKMRAKLTSFKVLYNVLNEFSKYIMSLSMELESSCSTSAPSAKNRLMGGAIFLATISNNSRGNKSILSGGGKVLTLAKISNTSQRVFTICLSLTFLARNFLKTEKHEDRPLAESAIKTRKARLNGMLGANRLAICTKLAIPPKIGYLRRFQLVQQEQLNVTLCWLQWSLYASWYTFVLFYGEHKNNHTITVFFVALPRQDNLDKESSSTGVEKEMQHYYRYNCADFDENAIVHLMPTYVMWQIFRVLVDSQYKQIKRDV